MAEIIGTIAFASSGAMLGSAKIRSVRVLRWDCKLQSEAALSGILSWGGMPPISRIRFMRWWRWELPLFYFYLSMESRRS